MKEILIKSLPVHKNLSETVLDALNINNIKNENENIIIERYFHRVIGTDGTDLNDIYKNVNNYFEIVTKNKNCTNFNFFNFSIAELYEEENFIDINVLFNNFAENFRTLLEKSYLKVINNIEDTSLIQKIIKRIVSCEKIIGKITNENQVIFAYGNAKEEDILFIYFMAFIGANVFYVSLNKNSNKISNTLENEIKYSTFIEMRHEVENIDFPSAKLINRETYAYEASKKIDEILFNEDTGIYKPFQFDDKNIININLKTTYDELQIMLKEEARMRQSFSHDDNNIYVPNIVAKVSGVLENLKEYKENIKTITTYDGVTILDMDTQTNALKGLSTLTEKKLLAYTNVDDKGNLIINVDKFANSEDFKYSYLKISAQKSFISKINQLINSNNIFNFELTNEKKISIATILFKINVPNICEMLHGFNYYGTIPKLLLFSKKGIDGENAYRLSYIVGLMSLLAFDVIIFSPAAFSDVERYFQHGFITEHKLSTIKSNLSYKEIIKKKLFF